MLNLPYYKDLCAMNLLNDDETQEIIKIVRAERGLRRGRGRAKVLAMAGRPVYRVSAVARSRGVQHGGVGDGWIR